MESIQRSVTNTSYLKKIHIIAVLVSGVVLFTLIFIVNIDFFKTEIMNGFGETSPQSYFDSGILEPNYTSNRKTSMPFQAAGSVQVKRRIEHGYPRKSSLQSTSNGKRRFASQLKQENVESDVHLHSSHTLPQEVIEGVKTFVFFIGYARSGSTIMSSLMDAHPHTIVSSQYGKVFTDKNSLTDKNYLFNELYKKSQEDAESGCRSEGIRAKNYSLNIPSLWQGKYDRYISLIGDKNAGKTPALYVKSPSSFTHDYNMLQKSIGVPMKAVFVVRNPFDIISTTALYDNPEKLSKIINVTTSNNVFTRKQQNAAVIAEYKSVMKRLYESGNMRKVQETRFETDTLEPFIRKAASNARGIEGIIDLVGSENVWQVHNMDLVNDPKKTLIEMCDFFEIDCSPDYIKTCAGTVFKSVSKTRDLLVWPQKEKQMVMDSIVRRFSFFNRYTFESD